MTDKAPFSVEKEGHLAWLILDRPEKRNTMSLRFFAGLTEHFKQFDADPEVRVVIIRAEGKSFTVGLDLAEAGAMLGDGSALQREDMRRGIKRLQDNISAVERCRKPVIAAIHGHCIGGGIDLTCACDIRLASRDAIFSIRETRIGIIADGATRPASGERERQSREPEAAVVAGPGLPRSDGDVVGAHQPQPLGCGG